MDQATQDRIHKMVTSYPVMLFMKGTPDEPRCGFSATVAQILKFQGTRFASFDVLADPDIREGIKAYGNWPTIPQLYVNGELLGGADIVRQMFESGELDEALKGQAEG
ncbi:MAG: Grx4 family monothiol glutaredoxin [Myxococcales bacterium]|nr:Grx4 family monothiol glutaredoxin [Myxococcales bacterium]